LLYVLHKSLRADGYLGPEFVLSRAATRLDPIEQAVGRGRRRRGGGGPGPGAVPPGRSDPARHAAAGIPVRPPFGDSGGDAPEGCSDEQYARNGFCACLPCRRGPGRRAGEWLRGRLRGRCPGGAQAGPARPPARTAAPV